MKKIIAVGLTCITLFSGCVNRSIFEEPVASALEEVGEEISAEISGAFSEAGGESADAVSGAEAEGNSALSERSGETVQEDEADEIGKMLRGETSYFNSFHSNYDKGHYSASGKATIRKDEEDELFLHDINAKKDKDIIIEAELMKWYGEIELVYRSEDGEEKIFSFPDLEPKENTVFSLEFTAKKGHGELFFRGKDARYSFTIEIK